MQTETATFATAQCRRRVLHSPAEHHPQSGTARNAMSAVVLQSTITCPACGTAKTETMPTDACQYFYVCSGCGTKLRPKSGDCCVFCSYGSVPCPPMQADRTSDCCAR